MDILELIKSRRSIRRYMEKAVPSELVRKILEAGRWAPSANNSQPWSFIVLKSEEVRRRVAEATTYGRFLANAPIGIAVVIDPELSRHAVEDGAIATMNMLLEAHALGLGACWIGAYNSPYEEKIKEILKIPKNKRILSIVSIGYPAESPSKNRKELDEIVFIDNYGNKEKL
ncbi:MAG: nitroreductase family protein [Candidatus Methanomethylicia archaeon]